jgi:hypothetical protein
MLRGTNGLTNDRRLIFGVVLMGRKDNITTDAIVYRDVSSQWMYA